MAATRKIVDYFVRLDDAGALVSLEIRSQVTSPDVFTGADLVQPEAETFERADLNPGLVTALDAQFTQIVAEIDGRKPLAP